MKTFPSSSRSTTAFWNAIRGRSYDKADLDERGSGDGSFILPSENSALFDEQIAKHNIFRQIASVIQTNSYDTLIRALTPLNEATFVQMGGPIPEALSGQIAINVQSHKIAELVRLSVDFVKDAGFDVPGAMAMEFGRSFGKAEEKACISGNGETEPFGVLHPEKGAETGVTVSSSNLIAYDDIVSLYFSLAPEYRRTAVWLMSDETAFALRKLKDSCGMPLWRHTDDSLFGRPVFTSPYMPGMATGTKPVLFGDFSFYWLMERGGAMIKILREKYIVHDQIGYIGSERIDGRLVKREAVKVLEMAQEA